ncbi:unnamed protein product [Didymodactylos carnosus]|uniref:Uncharacterized protein n=1 Tax=Didymodactylos carnosus TaxID=1234261 RepID=A0A814A5V2_9BILA|nr:unnamed protein product [Didymodactylos carnosus]CAF0908016.1 unnamed protein product [Didymodactylos carnosus]CAF3543279.1 unnamed protein product [Didymodactylos carnosus]CAF3689569.1 unnamed protein product [Didymodactylos carnosus]
MYLVLLLLVQIMNHQLLATTLTRDNLLSLLMASQFENDLRRSLVKRYRLDEIDDEPVKRYRLFDTDDQEVVIGGPYKYAWNVPWRIIP